jgi:hypothetical protein
MSNGRKPKGVLFSVLIVSAFVLANALPLTAKAEPVQAVPVCPKTFPLDGVKLTKVPEGWVGEVFEPFRLESVSIAIGDPTHENEIIPESKKVKAGSETIYSDLDGFGKQPWLICNYGYGGVVRLYQKLSPGIKRCTVKYVPYPGPIKFVFDSYRCE